MVMEMDIERKIRIIEEVLPRLQNIAAKCSLCGHMCGVDRLSGEKGKCHAGKNARVYSSFPHVGEEPPISGKKGSGTIFFSNCNLSCIYCQNNQFSQVGNGEEVSTQELAEFMIDLQKEGCHNINLVSPTHYMLPIAFALKFAYEAGLTLPVVYNTGGYDSFELIKILDGIADIYLADMRYSCDKMAKKYSKADKYVLNNRGIVKEMLRQTGVLKINGGIAVKGLIIRLLILPGEVSGTIDTLEYICRNLGREVAISIMSQYYPAYQASQDDILKNRISYAEYSAVADAMDRLGMTNGWIQPFCDRVDVNFAGENF